MYFGDRPMGNRTVGIVTEERLPREKPWEQGSFRKVNICVGSPKVRGMKP